MQNKPNLIGFGSVAVDDLFLVPSFPDPDTKLQVEDHLRLGGGLAGTALVAAARLGAKSAYFGVLGDNDLSHFTIDSFQDDGVQTHLCLHEESAKPLHSIIIADRSTGQRTILFSTDGFHVPPVHTITADKFEGCGMIFIDTFSLPIIDHVCSLAHSKSIPVIADIEHIDILVHKRAFDEISHLILNRKIAQQLANQKKPSDILAALETPTRAVSVLTDGANGCWYKERHRTPSHLAAFPVDAIDTTGCGDVFHGAYAAAILRGAGIADAILQASAAAALKATRPGGRAGIPDLSQLLDFISTHPDIQPMGIA